MINSFLKILSILSHFNIKRDLINRMFEPDFNKRITPEECLEHPWTKGIEAN